MPYSQILLSTTYNEYNNWNAVLASPQNPVKVRALTDPEGEFFASGQVHVW